MVSGSMAEEAGEKRRGREGIVWGVARKDDDGNGERSRDRMVRDSIWSWMRKGRVQAEMTSCAAAAHSERMHAEVVTLYPYGLRPASLTPPSPSSRLAGTGIAAPRQDARVIPLQRRMQKPGRPWHFRDIARRCRGRMDGKGEAMYENRLFLTDAVKVEAIHHGMPRDQLSEPLRGPSLILWNAFWLCRKGLRERLRLFRRHARLVASLHRAKWASGAGSCIS